MVKKIFSGSTSIMRQNKLVCSRLFFSFHAGHGCLGAKLKPDTKKHEQKVKDMVAFLEYVLNTLGRWWHLRA